MKSSHRNSPLSNVFSAFAVGLVAIVGFFIVGSSLPQQQSSEAVLGTTSDHTTTVKRSVNGILYRCKRTDCGRVSENNAIVDEKHPEAGVQCRAVKDTKGYSVCHWNNPIFTVAQCDGDKKIYRNNTYKNSLSTPGGMNQKITEDAENVVYYDCAKVYVPTATPTKTPTPTPAPAGCRRGWGQSCGAKACTNGGYAYCYAPYACQPSGIVNGKTMYKCKKKVMLGGTQGDSSSSMWVLPSTSPTKTPTPTPRSGMKAL